MMNKSKTKILVQKYGGSSLADPQRIKAVAERIGHSYDNNNKTVAVVCAMGDTTNKLIEMAKTVNGAPNDREMDLLLSTGEIVSCTLVTMALHSIGYPAIGLTGGQAGIHTDPYHSRAKILDIDTDRILHEIAEGKIVIVAGFQGTTTEMDVTTLGRGASDTTAVALAASLKADICEIYTDVDGIYTADPRIVPNARKLDEIGYEEMLELAASGAKMNPRSIELGALYNVPIRVTSSFSDSPGTLIH